MLFYELYTYSISALCIKTLVTKLVRLKFATIQ